MRATRTDNVAWMALGVLFWACTVAFLGFVLLQVLGTLLAILWLAAATPVVAVLIILLFRASGLTRRT